MNNIALIPNEIKDIGLICTQSIAKKLLEFKKTVYIPEKFREKLKNVAGVNFASDDLIFDTSELVLVVGGDGSIIRCARKAALRGIPVLGINMGRLGYLAELESDEIHMLKDVIDKDAVIEKRMMLSFYITKKDKKVIQGNPSINDIVLSSTGNTNRLVEIMMNFSDSDTPSVPFRGDGVIVSTPTGSTAYSLAAGGPVIDPTVECISVVPICTHSLTARPMIFSKDKTLKLINGGRTEVNVSADGCDEYTIEPGEYVTVLKSEYYSSFIKVRKSSFYEVLHRKMTE